MNTCQAAPDNSAAQRHFPRLPAEWSIRAMGEGFPLLHTAPQPPLGSLLEAQGSLAVSCLEASLDSLMGELVSDTSSLCRGTLKYNKQGKSLFP